MFWLMVRWRRSILVGSIRGAAVAVMIGMGGCADERATPPAVEVPRETAPDRIETSLAAAQTYLDSQEIAQAQAILMTLIERAPREPRAREMLGQSFVLAAIEAEKRGRKAEAAEWRAKAYEQYKIATDLVPDSAGLQHSAGLMALQAGQSAPALEHFRSAAGLDPANPQYPLFEAQLLIPLQRFDEAIAALQRVLAIDPDEPFAHASLAMIAMEQGRFDEALARIRKAREIQPDDLGLRVQEARICRRAGQPQRGLELLIGLSATERAQELVAFEVAACFDQLGEARRAALAWQHVFQADPMSPRAWLAAVRTGEMLLKAGEREQAALWLQQAQFAAPTAPEVIALEAAIAAN